VEHSSGKNEAGPSTVHRVIPSGSKDATDKGKGKQKLVADVVLGDTPRMIPVQRIAEEYLGKSLAVQKKKAQAELMIKFIREQAKDNAEDPAETERKVKEVIDKYFK